MSRSTALNAIDISPFVNNGPGADEVVQLWRSSMEQYGFAQIVGHGVRDRSILELQDSARFFFAQPRETKMLHCLGKGYGAGGYTPQSVESVAKSKDSSVPSPPDLVENYVFLRSERPMMGAVREQLNDFHFNLMEARANVLNNEMRSLLQVIMHLTATSLRLQSSYFDRFYEHPENHLRLASYPVVPSCERQPFQLAYGAHTDYTGFTFLKQDDTYPSALEIYYNERWNPVPPSPGALLVNAGDLIEIWTCGRIKSPLHRVVMPDAGVVHKPDMIVPQPRLSIVYFTGPSHDTFVEPIQELSMSESSVYHPILAGEHLRRKLANSNK